MSCHKCHSHITRSHNVTSHDESHDRHGKVVHRPYSSCISSIRKSNRNSIKFSLSIAKQRAVGFIPAWSLAFLHTLPYLKWSYLPQSLGSSKLCLSQI